MPTVAKEDSKNCQNFLSEFGDECKIVKNKTLMIKKVCSSLALHSKQTAFPSYHPTKVAAKNIFCWVLKSKPLKIFVEHVFTGQMSFSHPTNSVK